MSHPAQTLNIPKLVSDAIANVFDTMLNLPLKPVPENPDIALKNRITSAVGFGGETIAGVVYIHLMEPFARKITAAMLGMTEAEIGSESEVYDVMGELANIVTGGLKSHLCDAGALCAVSTPSIIRGDSYEIEVLPDIQRDRLVLDSEGNPVVIEIHVQFN